MILNVITVLLFWHSTLRLCLACFENTFILTSLLYIFINGALYFTIGQEWAYKISPFLIKHKLSLLHKIYKDYMVLLFQQLPRNWTTLKSIRVKYKDANKKESHFAIYIQSTQREKKGYLLMMPNFLGCKRVFFCFRYF